MSINSGECLNNTIVTNQCLLPKQNNIDRITRLARPSVCLSVCPVRARK